MIPRRAFAAALLCASFCMPAFAAEDAAAPTVQWVLPWKAGTTLVYAMEDTTTEVRGDQRSRSRSTSTTEVRITEASKEGFVQSWTGTGGRFQVLEGDRAAEALMQQFASAFDGVALEVQLNAAGNYARAGNIAELAPRLREAFLAGAQLGLDQQLAKTGEDVSGEARLKAMERMQGIVDRMTAPAVLEAMLTRNVQWYNGFVGIDVEPDETYELHTELPNPFGGPTFPATLTFSLAVSSEDPEDLFVSFDQRIDPEKGRAAVIGATRALLGEDVPENSLQALAFSMVDEGLFVVHRPTGTVEMFEAVRTTKFGDFEKVERHRLRLTSGGHGHVWRDEQEAEAAAAK